MTAALKIKAASDAIEALLDSEDIAVSSEAGDHLVGVQTTLFEAQRLAETSTVNNVALDVRQLAAVLAGLRLIQAELSRGEFLPQGVHIIYDCEGTIEPLTEDEIDDLCETINLA